MQNAGILPSRYVLDQHGIRNIAIAYWHLGTAQLVEHAIRRHEGLLAAGGPLVVRTEPFTGRSPKDKFVVRDEITESTVNWGQVNQPITEQKFDLLYSKVLAFWQGHELYVQDCFGGADPAFTLPIRLITESAWHNLFARQLFVRADPRTTDQHVPEFTLMFAPGFHADPAVHGTNSKTAIIINFKKKVVLILGTSYAGEMKKSVFTILNYILPARNVFPMHCSANVGSAGDVALFFGLSGTGKTTLSADPQRRLIGDDEHGWSDSGVFNVEGGCYAKTIRLSREGEPQIWDAIRFGSVLENVPLDPLTRAADYASERYTENTRAAYPIEFIANAEPSGRGGHPANIVFLTCDAFGVMPPLARLTPEQALYHFLSGYTAKVAGTEAGVTEPEATFSTCFAAPFLPLHPARYADLLADRLRSHGSSTWLVNTGWTGSGRRVPLALTRAMVRA